VVSLTRNNAPSPEVVGAALGAVVVLAPEPRDTARLQSLLCSWAAQLAEPAGRPVIFDEAFVKAACRTLLPFLSGDGSSVEVGKGLVEALSKAAGCSVPAEFAEWEKLLAAEPAETPSMETISQPQ
jgi:hypothetical protein